MKRCFNLLSTWSVFVLYLINKLYSHKYLKFDLAELSIEIYENKLMPGRPLIIIFIYNFAIMFQWNKIR